MDTPLKFEILAIDTTEKSEIQTVSAFLHGLASISLLSKGKPELDDQNGKINLGNLNVKVNQLKPTTEGD